MSKAELKEIIERLNEIIGLLKTSSKPASVTRRVVDGLATGAGILGILSAVDIIKAWIGG